MIVERPVRENIIIFDPDRQRKTLNKDHLTLYIGHFLAKKMHGYGIFIYKEGLQYEGYWWNGK
jgi:hypothetical protein